jgi:hypothetical protein
MYPPSVYLSSPRGPCAKNGDSMLRFGRVPQVLKALAEIAFDPEFLHSRIEKERRAVLAEAQMMNTIEYRVDCQLLQYLHEENALGSRFPIGKTEQVRLPPSPTMIHPNPFSACT